MVICDEKDIKADEYEDIIYNGLFSIVDNFLELPEQSKTIQVVDLLFMQDNAPCHKSTDILEFLVENCVPVIDWPTKSSDLNDIKTLWMDLKVHFHTSFLELFNYLSKSLEV